MHKYSKLIPGTCFALQPESFGHWRSIPPVLDKSCCTTQIYNNILKYKNF